MHPSQSSWDAERVELKGSAFKTRRVLVGIRVVRRCRSYRVLRQLPSIPNSLFPCTRLTSPITNLIVGLLRAHQAIHAEELHSRRRSRDLAHRHNIHIRLDQAEGRPQGAVRDAECYPPR